MSVEETWHSGSKSPWFKSSYSGAEGGDCVEIAWSKSSYSSSGGGECIEVAATAQTIHIRDSKNKTGPILSLAPEAWAAFLPFAAQG